MYYYIKGKIAYKENDLLVIDAGGVGYEIHTSATNVEKAGEIGKELTVYTYLHVREDIQDLYGFLSIEERKMFLILIAISGVGPKAALSILSANPPSQLAAAVIKNDAKAITKAQGVGPKMAQRVILELRDKIKNEDIILDDSVEETVSVSDSAGEAVSALVALGYNVQEAKNAVSKVDNSLDVEEIIKKALSKLF